ncbi:MAG: sarcosine oxidase subunit gamma [Geminicoccaceae bacterium]|nr:sarcosine oxidase subunit gamma [Geminicoccaceae bacterium]HRY24253.1 sarcosine oxidase subunit gamma family protein [Geminicoccaceae bacterium]
MVELRERPVILRPATTAEGSRCRVAERLGLCLTQVIARPGQERELARILGQKLPERPGTAMTIGDGTVMALRPRDWLLVRHDPVGRRGGLAVDLRRRLDGVALVIDQSHGRVVLRLEGAASRSVLQKGIDIDLHPDQFGPGAAAQTGIAGMAVLVHAVADEAFDLYGNRSFAESLLDWLLEAGREWGIVLEASGT